MSTAQHESAHTKVEDAVKKLNGSKELFEFIRNVESLNELRIELDTQHIPNRLFTGGSAGLDVEILGECLRKVVAELVDSREPCSNAEIATRTGIPKDRVSLCTYYLRAIGLVSAKKQGRSFFLELTTNQIRKGAITSAITSIQGLQPNLVDRVGPSS